MLVRQTGTKTFRRWDGNDINDLAAAGSLHTDRGHFPGATPWRIAGVFPEATIPVTYTDIIPGFTSARVLPTSPGTIQVERANAADTGALLVEYLDSNWYHRSAVYVLTNATTTLAAGLGTGDTAGQPVSAIRILYATYLGTVRNVGQIDVKIGVTNVQARIIAEHRGNQSLSWTVPRGQRLQISSYRVAVDAGKTIAVRIEGSVINTATGTRRTAVRNEFADVSGSFSDSYRPDGVYGTGFDGLRQYAPLDFAFLMKQAAEGVTTGAIDGLVRGVILLDEEKPDPEPLKIPWVLAEVNRLISIGLWPLP